MADPKYVSKHYNCEEIDQRLLQGYYDDFVDKTGYSGNKDSFLIDLFSSINLLKDKRFIYLPANIGLEHFPEWSSGNKYLKGKVVFHNSLLFRANNTHTSGASFDDDASLWSTTTLSELVEEDLTSTITVDEMVNFNPLVDEGSSYLAGFLDKPSRYVVTKEVGGVPVNVGILEILSDSIQHVYTQVFTTHFVLDNSGNLDLGAHDDTKLVTYFRSYSIDSPFIDSGTWTKWEDISHYDVISANLGFLKYPLFNKNINYSKGYIVRYENHLYRFTAEHAAGAWIGTDVEEWSVKDELDTKTEAEDTAEVIKGIEETLVTDALRKSAQILTDNEKRQARKNIGAASTDDYAKAISDLNKQQDKFESSVRNVVENYKPVVINGNVSNAADEEDITSDENNLLKLKDRNNLDGMGYVILRKNKTFAEQVTLANTIYEIRYDFDLDGAEVEIPENCALKFEGGSLRNGILHLNNTSFLGSVKCVGMSKITGMIDSNTIISDNYTFTTDEEKIIFLLNQIDDNKKIVINGEYTIDYTKLKFESNDFTFKSGRTIPIVGLCVLKKKIHNLTITGTGVINITNNPTKSYRELIFFSQGIADSVIEGLTVNGDIEYYQTDISFGINFLKIIGDSENNFINITCNHLAIPIYYGDYYGNDGLHGLINSQITVNGYGNKYGSRFGFINDCQIKIVNSYGHRGCYIAGGANNCNITVHSKYMDTNAALIIGNTYINDVIEGARNVNIFLYDTGTETMPGRVFIASHGGAIDNGISMRDYSIYYSNIYVEARYSYNTNIQSAFMPVCIGSNGDFYTGRELVPDDILDLKIKAIIENNAYMPKNNVLLVCTIYDTRYRRYNIEYEIQNISSNKELLYQGNFPTSNNFKMSIKTDVRLTPMFYRSALPSADWLLTQDKYEGTCRYIIKSEQVYFPTIPDNVYERSEAILDYVILDNNTDFTSTPKVQIPIYRSDFSLAKKSGTTTQRPLARKGDIYYDTTLNKPIWWTGSKWVDVTGTEV